MIIISYLEQTRNSTKNNVKSFIAILLILGIGVFGIHLWQVYTANEFVLTSKILNNSSTKLIFSEKRNTLNSSSATNPKIISSNNQHIGYCLELFDSTANKSLDKVEFKAPVREIESIPQLIIINNTTAWLVSTSNFGGEEKPGFILKFSVLNGKIIQQDFNLDKKYLIRDLSKNKIIITEGNINIGNHYDEVFGCTYFDLETESITTLKPLNISDEIKKLNP